MSKIVKFTIPRGASRVTQAFPKTSSHSTYRCKRKPNSPLCRKMPLKREITNKFLKSASSNYLHSLLSIHPTKIGKELTKRSSVALQAKYAEDQKINNLEERLNAFTG